MLGKGKGRGKKKKTYMFFYWDEKTGESKEFLSILKFCLKS